MSTARWITGDVHEALAQLEDGSVDLVAFSPPFLALRSYLPEDHPDKALEIGSESTPAEWLDVMLGVVEALARKLSRYGSLAVEIGDTFAGSGGAGGDYNADGFREGQAKFSGSAAKRRRDGITDGGRPARQRQRPGGTTSRTPAGRLASYSDDRGNPDGMRDPTFSGANTRSGGGAGWPLDKSLCMIPALFAASLAYGRNILRAPLSAFDLLDFFDQVIDDDHDLSARDLLDMMHQYVDRHTELGPVVGFEPWRVRNLIAWSRANPPVGSLGDKFRPATSYITVATRARDRWFDLDAVRGPGSGNTHARTARGVESRPSTGKTADDERRSGNWSTLDTLHDTNGAPPRDWWNDITDTLAGYFAGLGNDGPSASKATQVLRDAGCLDTGDHWLVNPTGFKGAHYAVWPPALVRPLVESMCPRKVCVECGEPSRRIVGDITLDSYRNSDRPQTIKAVALADEHGLTDEHIAAIRAFGTSDAGKAPSINNGAGKNTDAVKALAAEAKAALGGYFREFVMSTNAERGSSWSDCCCGPECVPARWEEREVPAHHRDDGKLISRARTVKVMADPGRCDGSHWRRGRVLDPFAGSGTTLEVATGLGRDSVGIDLDPRNLDLARARVGMFLVEDRLGVT